MSMAGAIPTAATDPLQALANVELSVLRGFIAQRPATEESDVECIVRPRPRSTRPQNA
jgi:hypothetical protein